MFNVDEEADDGVHGDTIIGADREDNSAEAGNRLSVDSGEFIGDVGLLKALRVTAEIKLDSN